MALVSTYKYAITYWGQNGMVLVGAHVITYWGQNDVVWYAHTNMQSHWDKMI